MTENIDVAAAAGAPVAPENISPPENVELTIRQAYQADNDFVFTCPTSWTIKQVKEHVRNGLDSHPAVSTQRLIFSGASLRDEQILSNIIKERSHLAGEQIFFHLMISLPYQAPNGAAASARVPNPPPVNPRLRGANSHYGIVTSSYNRQLEQNQAAWRTYWEAYGQLTPEAQHDENQRLMAHYFSYATISLPPNYLNPGATPGAEGREEQLDAWRVRLRGRAAAAAPVVAAAAAAAAAPQAAPAAAAAAGGAANARNGPRPRVARIDLLEITYRVFKLVLLLSACLLYTSFERFAVVICVGLFIYFVQLRRNHQRMAGIQPRGARNAQNIQLGVAAPAPAQDAAPAAAQEGGADNQEQHVNNNNNGENDGENAPPPAEGLNEDDAAGPQAAPAEQQTGMQLFLATCYSFVTSFFASLVPDHPMPMDLN